MINILEAFKNEDGSTKKKFGQHFLSNKFLLEKIVEVADIDESDNVVEIGPGCGVLTQLLCETKANIKAIEIDRELTEFLKRYLFFYKNIEILNINALNIDYNDLLENKQTIFIGNLPYNVSVKIFEKVAMYNNIKNMVFMFQKEVADRIIAKPNSKAYSSLSVFTRYLFDTSKVRDISGANFWPNTLVTSSVIKFTPKENRYYNNDKEKEEQFFKFLRASFKQKRKTLKNNLQMVSDIENILIDIDLKSTTRAEEMELEKFIELFDIIYGKYTF